MDDSCHAKVTGKSIPFYSLSPERKSSLEIINEARASLKAVKTKRPFTPLEKIRRLYGGKEACGWNFSNARFECYPEQGDSLARPLPGIRLAPLKHQSCSSRIEHNSEALNNCSSSCDQKDLLSINEETNVSYNKVQDALHNEWYNKGRKSSEDKDVLYAHSKEGVVKRNPKTSRRKQISEEISEVFMREVYPLISTMNSEKVDGEVLIDHARNLFDSLQKNNLFLRNFKERSTILRTVFNLLDQYDTKLLLFLSKIILAMNVSGKNLTTLCKLLYKVSRNEVNDQLFAECQIFDSFLNNMLSMKPITYPETLVYSGATLKFLAANETLRPLLYNAGVIDVIINKLVSINDELLGTRISADACSHILAQFTAALRNVLEMQECMNEFVNKKGVKELCRTLEINCKDYEVVKNVCRIISKISAETSCANLVKDHSFINSLLHIIKVHKIRQDVVVRACFILGNIADHSSKARVMLYNEKNWLNVLFSTLQWYIELDLKPIVRDTADAEDVMIKVIRVFANMSIDQEIGSSLAQNEEIMSALLSILSRKDLDQNTEVVKCILSTLNNLSFYCLEDSALYDKQDDFTLYLISILKGKDDSSIVDALRVLGNLSRVKHIRDIIIENNGATAIVSLLDNDNSSIIYCSCGIVMNLMLDEEKKTLFSGQDVIQKLVCVLQDFAQGDWRLCGLVCQAIWNFFSCPRTINSPAHQDDIENIIYLLQEYADPENVICDELEANEQTRNFIKQQWEEEYITIASDLLLKLKINFEDPEFIE